MGGKQSKNEKKSRNREYYDKSKLRFHVFNDIKDIEKYPNYGILPTEVIHQIFIFLPPHDHLNVSLTSKLFMLIGNTEYFWKAYSLNSINSNVVKREEERYGNAKVNWKHLVYRETSKFKIKDEKYYKGKYGYFGLKDGTEPKAEDVVSFKLVLIGKSGGGKSSLVLRFVRDQFFEYQESTIGAAFLTQIIGRIKLGQERYESLAPMYYRGGQIMIICYSITDLAEFKNMKKTIVRSIKRKGQDKFEGEILLVGCKSDLVEQRQVSYDQGMRLAEEENFLGFVECSSQSGNNVMQVFGAICEFLEEKLFNEGYEGRGDL